MPQEDTTQAISEIVELVSGTPAAQVTPETSFADDLGIDSLTMIDVVVGVEDRFGVESQMTISPVSAPSVMPPTTSTARESTSEYATPDRNSQGASMPFIQVHLAEGRSPEQKRALLLAISAAVESSIGAPAESIRVWISEFRREEFVVSGRIAADARPAEPDTATSP